MRQTKKWSQPAVLMAALTVGLVFNDFSASPALAADSAHPRAVWQSLTPAERKLPRDILVQQLLAQGKPVPPGWQRAAKSRSKSSDESEVVTTYRVTGSDIDLLRTAIALTGLEVRTVSESRGYVIADLTSAQVVDLANYAVVTKIQRVKGPAAQGITSAWTAHRFDDMTPADKPDFIVGKPELTGSEVVVAIISLPVTQEDVDDLTTETDSRLPPTYDHTEDPAPPATAPRLYLYGGLTGEATEGLSVLSATGVDAGLNMAQVVHDIAPEAKIVLASPGAGSDPQEMANVIAALVAGRGAAGEENYIPPADIIVDDLDYLSQNPFEIDLVSEAIAAASESGTLYVTAAGDSGQYKAQGATSNVFIDQFNSIAPPNSDGIFGDEDFFNQLHGFPNNQYYLTVEEPLQDLCLFWNEEPGAAPFNDLDLIVWTDTDNDGVVDDNAEIQWEFLESPGACLSELQSEGADPVSIAADSRIIIGDFEGSNQDRFILVGERTDESFVNQDGDDAISKTFSLTTAGSIRGHAYSNSALTAGGAPYFTNESDEVVAYWDVETEALADTLAANTYSSDGEGAGSQRFFWEKDEQSAWQAVSSTAAIAAPRKPDLIAASAIEVRTVTQNSDEGTAATITSSTYHGTSASAAVAAGASALYWQFREWQISEGTVTGPVAPDEVLSAVRGAVRGNQQQVTWNQLLGYGVLDAPRSLEAPLPASNPSLTEVSPGTLEVTFDRAFNDLSADAAFEYRLECTYEDNTAVTSPATVILEPADSTAVGTKAPLALYPVNGKIGEDITCEITTVPTAAQQTAGWSGTGTTSVTVGASALRAPTVTMTSRSAGVTMQFAASPDDDEDTTVGYSAECTASGSSSPISGWPTANGEVTPHTSGTPSIYPRPVNPGTTVSCTVTATLARDGAPALTLTAQGAGSATSGTPAATTLTMTPESGGVQVSWTVDPNLVSGASAAVTLNCTQGSTQLVNQVITGSGYFVEADQSAPVRCTITTAISGSGITTINQGPVTKSASAEEEIASGLPIWLLYVATQPQVVTEVEHSPGMSLTQTVDVQVDLDESAAQTFTTAITGELTSVSVYLRNSVGALADNNQDDLTIEIRSVSTGTPSAEVLATQAVAASDVPANAASPGKVTVEFATPASLTAGETYAIVVRSTDAEGYKLWSSSVSSIYDGGSGHTSDDGTGSNWTAQDYDFSFETVMRYTQ